MAFILRDAGEPLQGGSRLNPASRFIVGPFKIAVSAFWNGAQRRKDCRTAEDRPQGERRRLIGQFLHAQLSSSKKARDEGPRPLSFKRTLSSLAVNDWLFGNRCVRSLC